MWILVSIIWSCTSNAEVFNPQRAEAIKQLTPLQYSVTQKDGTEPPFDNEYWDNNEAGIYVDIVSGEVLFSSTHKYKSGTGWPSFYDFISGNVTEKPDNKYGWNRTEVECARCGSHLGHVFEDGPAPSGLRYYINGVALKFKKT